MTPFCKSKRGGSQERERELVVVRGAVKLDGAPVGTVKVGGGGGGGGGGGIMTIKGLDSIHRGLKFMTP